MINKLKGTKHNKKSYTQDLKETGCMKFSVRDRQRNNNKIINEHNNYKIYSKELHTT